MLEKIRLLDFNIKQEVRISPATYNNLYGEIKIEYINKCLECIVEDNTLTFQTSTELTNIYQPEGIFQLQISDVKKNNLINSILKELRKLLVIDINDPNFQLSKKYIKPKLDYIQIETYITIPYLDYQFYIQFSTYNTIIIGIENKSIDISIGLLDNMKEYFDEYDYFRKYYNLYNGFKEVKDLME